MFDRTLQRAIAALLVAGAIAGAAVAQDTPATTPDTTTSARPAVLGQGDKGDAVLEAQVKLDRAHFSPGEIDGAFGSNVARAVAAFQQSRGLDPSGRLDAATWAALDADGAPVLTDYTLTAEDVEGPFVDVPTDMMAKSRLEFLGSGSPLEGLA